LGTKISGAMGLGEKTFRCTGEPSQGEHVKRIEARSDFVKKVTSYGQKRKTSAHMREKVKNKARSGPIIRGDMKGREEGGINS